MQYDLAVIGGGINGTGIAREAAYRGYRTLLLEKDDFAQATSSQSTKMIHGGIRYLETGDFHLVYESLRERAILLRIAPHLVRPLEIVIPVYSGSPRPAWLVRLGVFLYDLLAGRRNIGRSHVLSPEEMAGLKGLRQEGLRTAVAYNDAQVFDSRLCLETALSAGGAGATVLNYHPVERAARLEGGYLLEGRERRHGRPFAFEARVVINATGPWSPFLEKMTLSHPTKEMVYDRGIHLVVPSLGLERGLALMCDDRRLIFVLPWREDFTLIGTTETRFEGDDFTRVPVSEEEVQYLLDNFNGFFPERRLTRDDILHYYSGVRTLVAGHGTSLTRLSREAEVRIFPENGGAWAIVYGGKLTSYRALAEHTLDKLAKVIPPPRGGPGLSTSTEPLHGGGQPPEASLEWGFLTPSLKKAWLERYAGRWVDVAALAASRPELQQMVLERFQFTRADLAYMVTVELAFKPEDITLRRTTMGYTMSDEEMAGLTESLRHFLETAPPPQPAPGEGVA